MDKNYDLIKEVRSDVRDIQQTLALNTEILREHQRRSLANENRLALLEKQAIKVNWKTVALISGMVCSWTGLALTALKYWLTN
jgi:hypothetical protein